jgi:xanthine dehydrogenase small subunit
MSSGTIRDYIVFYVNGRECRVTGQHAFMQLSDYLRAELGLCGTKVVCAEGDCGACTVLVGRTGNDDKLSYKPLNSCIQTIYQLDCAHIVTVEGLTPEQQLSPIQESMVECHGAQCGFCTPGFVVSLAAMFEDIAARNPGCGSPALAMCAESAKFVQSAGNGDMTSGKGSTVPVDTTNTVPVDTASTAPIVQVSTVLDGNAVTRAAVKDALTGNLCRCTGYESIIKSAMQCDASSVVPVEVAFPSEPIVKNFKEHASVDVKIEVERGVVFIPHELDSAVQFKYANDGATVVSGGTDVCVNINKRGFKPRKVLSICNLSGLDNLEIEDGKLIIGARVTLERLAQFSKDALPELANMLWIFGAPQIRHAGTMAGNIANGSPIGDTLPFLFVMEAEIEVYGVRGPRRIPICSFYTGYKQMDMARDELITRIIVPLPKARETLRLFKVSRREHLDISSLGAAFLVGIESSGDSKLSRVKYARVALGGVGPTTVRLPRSEEFLKGKQLLFETFERAGEIALTEIKPISDVRGSSDFRNQLAENMFLKFYCSLDESESLCAV